MTISKSQLHRWQAVSEAATRGRSPNVKDLVGQVFARLTVLQFAGTERGHAHWLCACECGTKIVVRASNLKQGNVKSCKCLYASWNKDHKTKHGMARTPEWIVWRGMHARCSQPQRRDWEQYGGRGIRVCERWSGEVGFQNFFSDMGPRPIGLTIDRIDNDLGYEPSNCRWATWREQRLNQRRMAAALRAIRGEK